ncbi:DUF2723 domain-containing protein [Dysgonomonas sp. 25]|uniref:glycosyltransferase family 117 protein n=1 Tax=Dysgonomonas sp. 25 TaxID=2302933 RepID=UPI0013D81CBF|nr:DUF2723 domain-containing protein [Dysgonomonas sp. 25]NDV68946.1 DUF2723 domain-containing protein [Dysgonomonas sp. 25]
MKKYNLINNLCGWFAFLVAAIVYLLTIEPTASFWDCGEFIASADKLEVGHPPGAPFFMITGKFFTLFASDVQDVARMVNSMSALLSAATILFLFWTISHLARKLIYTDTSKDITLGQTIAIMGSGLVGALAYTFSDTFWFSAVEGEVYAYSSMFTALVFWLILKWENRADQPGSDKWLVLIAYCMGLSIGVHLLNLLCIPAIGMVYYFKKAEKPNLLGLSLATLLSGALIVVLMYGIIPGFTKVGGWIERLFVNEMGFAYNTGTFFYFAILIGAIVWGLYESFAKKGNLKRAKVAFVFSLILSGIPFMGSNVLLSLFLMGALVTFVLLYKKLSFRLINTILLSLLVILIGYSSFALIPIRSAANTPMDQNSPENIFTLASYLNREQYGDRPLFYGQTYASELERDASGNVVIKNEKESWDEIVKMSPDEKDRYYVASKSPTYAYTNTMAFPRMYSTDVPRHLLGYRIWGSMKDQKVPPTFFDNMEFFLSYQLNYMYFRYFMWNFSGRQNDIQGTGTISNGNWITGIGFIDEHVLGLGPQDDLPPNVADNKGHNTYYALPFILGLLGIAFQLTRGRKGEQQFLVTFMLFFMTGIAIILYLNQQPFEPRERDYAYAGSFYAFCIWIGFGVAAIYQLLKKVLPETPAAAIASVLLLGVPIQMAAQNWDDHDRSDRYAMRDFGENYLKTCEPDAILFTNGDNDTFPLWYVQEVEGYRTDVRVCNLSYLQTDWYVDQMRRQAYDSKPLPIEWERDRYMGEKGRAAYVLSRKDLERVIKSQLDRQEQRWGSYIDYSRYFDTAAFKNEMLLDDVLNIVKTKDNYAPANPFVSNGVVIPASKFVMPIDTANVNWEALGTKPTTELVFDMGDGKGGIYRQELMILEMLNNINKDGWKRPIYYAATIGDYPLNINSQLVLEGINYRILPGKTNAMRVDTEAMYDNMMHKFAWGNVWKPSVYLDENTLRMCRTFRLMFARLIPALIQEGKDEKALEALDYSMEVLPGSTIPRGEESMVFASSYYALGQEEKGDSILNEIYDRAERSLQWYARLDQYNMMHSNSEINEYISIKTTALGLYQQYNKEKYQELLPQAIDQMQVFMSNYVNFDNRDHPLDYIYYLIARDARDNAGNEAARERAQELAGKVFNIMHAYNPKLLEKYQGGAPEGDE